jgi:hypothetical protein
MQMDLCPICLKDFRDFIESTALCLLPLRGSYHALRKSVIKHTLRVYRTRPVGPLTPFRSHFRPALFAPLTIAHSTSTRSVSHARQTNTTISQTSNSHSLDTKHVFLVQVSTFTRFRYCIDVLRIFECVLTENQLIWTKIRKFRIFRNFSVEILRNSIFRNSCVDLATRPFHKCENVLSVFLAFPPPQQCTLRTGRQ